MFNWLRRLLVLTVDCNDRVSGKRIKNSRYIKFSRTGQEVPKPKNVQDGEVYFVCCARGRACSQIVWRVNLARVRVPKESQEW